MTSTVYIRTYTKDLPWFKWCLASLEQFWAEDSRILVNCEPEDAPIVAEYAKEVAPSRQVEVTEWVQWGNNRGYLFQQWAKLTADQLTDSEVIAYFDSDLVLNRAVGLADFMDRERRRFRWFYESYSSVAFTEPAAKRWLNATWRAFNLRPEHEFMRRHPFILWRETVENTRKYLENQHGALADYLLNLPGSGTDVDFSEFNCLGFYAWLFQKEKYWWLDVTENQELAGAKYWSPGTSLSINPVDQHHSWTGDPEQAHQRFLQACQSQCPNENLNPDPVLASQPD